MAKKRRQNEEKAREERTETKHVRMEITVIIALIALVVGFFAGEIFDLSKSSRPTIPVQPSPPARQPSQMPSLTPQQGRRIFELEREVASNPGNAEAWTELGHVYFDGNDVKQAIRAYKKALDLNPYDADVWTDLGVMYRRNKQPLEAMAAFNKAADIDPRHEQSRFNKGIVLMHDLDDREGAIKAWEELLKVSPNAKAGMGQSVREMVEGLKKEQKEQKTP
jgi:cytochrome c-type biogenesis protein CcmH/NrfG